MSERITSKNLDEVVRKNALIHRELEQNAQTVRAHFNQMQLYSSPQLALQILASYGLLQMPIDNEYLSGAIFLKNGTRIPVINTALPRVNQYFTAWHEVLAAFALISSFMSMFSIVIPFSKRHL